MRPIVELKEEFPCSKLGYCPYGVLVEEYPLDHGEKSCPVFGHDCPVYYLKSEVFL
jgi:hypothetical protein